MTIEYSNLPVITELSYATIDSLYICALGFEDRCNAALKRLLKLGYRCRNSILLKYDVLHEENNVHYEEIKCLLESVTVNNIYECTYRTSDFYTNNNENADINLIFKKLCKSGQHDTVSVDISSFSTSAIIQILDMLLLSNISQLRVIYTEAIQYFPIEMPKTYQEEEYLSSGIKEIVTLPNFSGIHTPGYSQLYILILGFEPIRAKGVLDIYQPSKKVIILGKPSKDNLMWRLDLLKEMYKFSTTGQDEQIILSQFNYDEVFYGLEEIYKKYCQFNNITVVPLGSKMQTLALLLFLKNHPDVKLLISIPKRYDPRRYSEGVGKTFEIKFKIRKRITGVTDIK